MINDAKFIASFSFSNSVSFFFSSLKLKFQVGDGFLYISNIVISVANIDMVDYVFISVTYFVTNFLKKGNSICYNR